MHNTNAFLNDKGTILIAPRMEKYKEIIKPLYTKYRSELARKATEDIKRTRGEQQRRRSVSLSGPSGSGLIIIPSNINELVKRHQLLLGSYEAGNTGVYNEIQAINDRLFSEGILNEKDILNFSKFFLYKNDY